MAASGAAPPLHEPELGLIWSLNSNRGMSNTIRLAYLREPEWILAAHQRFRGIAKHPCSLGNRGDGFRLVLEAGAVDQPNRIINADQPLDGVGDLVEREPLRQSAVELHRGEAHLPRVIIAKDVN